MKIAIYGTEIHDNYLSVYQRIFSFFDRNDVQFLLHSRLKEILKSNYNFETNELGVFNGNEACGCNVDFILSVGGDGTFLSAVNYALIEDAPVLGINCGRLGFLADIASEELEEALTKLLNGQYEIDQRSLLEMVEPKNLFESTRYALNELTVHKMDNSSMLNIKTYINGEFLTNYWADGLIVATPTGSTAYSLSVGGPIISPDLGGWIITPLASHNLSVRPIVVPDFDEVELRIEGRGNQFRASFDHQSTAVGFSTVIKIRKASVYVPMVKLHGQSFYITLRNKLMWGADRRN